MEDGFPLFDPNDEAARAEQKLREYYEEFSVNARQRLLAMTIVRPTSVYDVLYPQTREALLAKNVPIVTDLEEDSKVIRDRLISKIITNETDLERISENFRNALLARKKIQEDTDRLLINSEVYRKTNLSKNSYDPVDLDKTSEAYRHNNLSKNKPNPSTQTSIDKTSEEYRHNALSKNVAKDQDLLRDSELYVNQYKKKDLHKNVPNETDLERDSIPYRHNNLSKKSTSPGSIDDYADDSRRNSLSKNSSRTTDLEASSEEFRMQNESKNVSKDQDLLRDSEDIRNGYKENDLNKNVSIKSDLEKDSVAYRRNNLGNNSGGKVTDLESDSIPYRTDDLSKNKPVTTDLESDSIPYRTDDLSKNKPVTTDLEKDSEQFRKDDLSMNKPVTTDLEKDSEQFRKDDLSMNKPVTTDLERDSASYREDDLSMNKPVTTDLEKDSEQFRADDLSLNVPSESDLEADSASFREDDLSLNKPKSTDLERDSIPYRADDLSKNKPVTTDLEKDSVPYRADDLSFNKPKVTDLETDSVPYREDDLSFNTPKITNLETDSVPFREDDLSLNVPINSDIETDSVPFREDDLSFNVPIVTDLLTDSTPYLYNNLSANVPVVTDLETDSIPFREDDLSANVPSFSNLETDSVPFREDDLAMNVPNTSNLEVDSAPFRNDDLAMNVPNFSNLESDSAPIRDQNLAMNVPSDSDLLQDSKQFRDDAVAKNAAYGLLGVNIEGIGTSTFLGVSRVFTQGILIRQLLLSKNKPNNTDLYITSQYPRANNISANRWQLSNQEYTSTSGNFDLGPIMQGKFSTSLVDYTRIDPYSTPTSKAVLGEDNFNLTVSKNLQNFYGTSRSVDFPTGRKEYEISDALFSTDPSNPRGGSFADAVVTVQTYKPYSEGIVTETIRKYNQERNAFNISGLQAGNPESLNTLNGINLEGFQELINKTIGSFKAPSQTRTITTPADVITANEGAYFKGGNRDTDILRPDAGIAEIGSAESMMAKTVPGNPFNDEDFQANRRGVKYVQNVIKGSDNIMAKNFDPQNNRAYIIGTNRDGSPKVSRQRFTIANPYAPQGAGKLIFSLQNYSSGQRFFFPPYIQSIQNTENASWNSTEFLGRPEAVYTYNNSSRDASISFFVLTDYAQSVDIGRDWNSETMDRLTETFDRHFTQKDKSDNGDDLEKLNKKRDELKTKSQDLQTKIDENPDGDNDEFRQELQTVNTELAKVEGKIGAATLDSGVFTNYSEANNVGTNVYNINIDRKDFENGDIVYKAEETAKRIDTMRSGLMFQPAFFSGDKVDFVRRIEFLSKMTRPSASPTTPDTGFAFTKAPVCHIKLGDWWDHDIIVNSVSYDYADAPWTLDPGGRVQPMWALVSINFNIIGPYGSKSSRPPLSTDAGGMFSPYGGV